MSGPPNQRVSAPRSSTRDRTVAAAITVLCAMMVTGLWLVSRSAPSAVQLDSVSLVTDGVFPDEGCTNFGEFWTTGSGVHVPVEAIEGLTNCRQAADGTWFVPSGPDDARLTSRSVPTTDQSAATALLASMLLEDLAALQDQLPNSLIESLSAHYDEVNQAVFGHTLRGKPDLTVKRNRYSRIAQAFLIDPNRTVIADYVGWAMERRARAADTFEASCRADPDLGFMLRACTGIRNEFAVSQIPLYWDLTDPVLINEYLIARSVHLPDLPEPTAESIT